MTLDGKYYRYHRGASSFLDRARAARARFVDQHDVEALFVAALMLRTGIEARLFEYIEAAFPLESRRDRVMRISEYAASKLLRRLCEMNPDAKREVIVRITPTQGGESLGLRYTPVTDSLAAVHGRLGEVLHYNFFTKNPHWYVADRVEQPGLHTLLHVLDLIDQGIAELEEACAGNLLGHTRFSRIVSELESELPDSESNGPRADEPAV